MNSGHIWNLSRLQYFIDLVSNDPFDWASELNWSFPALFPTPGGYLCSLGIEGTHHDSDVVKQYSNKWEAFQRSVGLEAGTMSSRSEAEHRRSSGCRCKERLFREFKELEPRRHKVKYRTTALIWLWGKVYLSKIVDLELRNGRPFLLEMPSSWRKNSIWA